MEFLASNVEGGDVVVVVLGGKTGLFAFLYAFDWNLCLVGVQTA